MDDFAVYYLRFDSINGPQVVSRRGNIALSDFDANSLRSCAFPDTVVQSLSESTLFVFKVSDYYCYTIFTTTADPSAPRGHRQISYVIATEIPYIYPFTRILHSSMGIQDYDPSDVLLLISDFVTKSIELFPKKNGDNQQIPTFDGGLPVARPETAVEVLDTIGGIGWTPLCKCYFMNDHFLDIDLVSTFSLSHLINIGHSSDLLRLWEAGMLNESVMVYAANPTLASAGSLAIGSLNYPEPFSSSILPFISVTDPRYITVTKNPKGRIVGFSNPIAIQQSSNFDLVLQLGFNDISDGLQNYKGNWNFLIDKKQLTSGEIRHYLYVNTCKVRVAIESCMQELREVNPYVEYVGQVDARALAKHLEKQQVALTMPYKRFATKLLRSYIFSLIWKERCTNISLIRELRNFSIDPLCTGRTEHELIDLFSILRTVRRTCAGNKELETIIDADLTTVTLYLSPDLILAPS